MFDNDQRTQVINRRQDVRASSLNANVCKSGIE
jgi:hypothetical protein